MIQDIIKKTIEIVGEAIESIGLEIIIYLIGIIALYIGIHKICQLLFVKNKDRTLCECNSCKKSTAEEQKKITTDLDLNK